jgi:prepilin-type N-terminal cleavage/methylation domain-containing protein
MRMARFNTDGRKAFTLIELTVVILLIAIMSAAIIPAMRGTYQDALLRSTSRDLVNSLGIAYSRAVSLNQLHRIRFDTRTGRYLIERRDPAGVREEFLPIKDIPGCEGTLDARISLLIHKQGDEASDASSQPANLPAGGDQAMAETDSTVSFYPDGTADAVELELRDRDGFRLALQINPTTARVHIVELKREQ